MLLVSPSLGQCTSIQDRQGTTSRAPTSRPPQPSRDATTRSTRALQIVLLSDPFCKESGTWDNCDKVASCAHVCLSTLKICEPINRVPPILIKGRLSRFSTTERHGRVVSTSACIREVPSSNFGPETESSVDWGFSSFPSALPGKCRDSTLNYSTTFSFFVLSNLSFINHLIIPRCTIRISDSIVKEAINEYTNLVLGLRICAASFTLSNESFWLRPQAPGQCYLWLDMNIAVPTSRLHRPSHLFWYRNVNDTTTTERRLLRLERHWSFRPVTQTVNVV
jgi:hypothetical protein